jgi:hypothetical protein
MADAAEEVLIRIAVSGQNDVISALGEIGTAGESIFERLSSSLGLAGEAFAGIITAAVGIGVGLEAMAASSANAAREMGNLSTLTGASVEQLSGLEGGLSQYGISVDQLGYAFRRLSVTVERTWEEIEQTTKRRTDTIINDQLAVGKSHEDLFKAQQTYAKQLRDLGIPHAEIPVTQFEERTHKQREALLALQEAQQKAREAEKKQTEDQLNDLVNVAAAVDKVSSGQAKLADVQGKTANLTTENVIKGLVVNTAGASEAIENFSGNLADLANMQPKVLDVFARIADYMHNSGNAAQNSALSFRLFGRNAQELTAVLTQVGGEGLRDLAKRFKDLGFATDDAEVALGKKFTATLSTVRYELKQLKDQVGSQFIEGFDTGFKTFQDALEHNRGAIVAWARSFAETTRPAILDFFNLISGKEVKTDWIRGLGEVFKSVWEILKSVGEAVKGFVTGLSGGNMDQVVGGWEKLWAGLGVTVRTTVSIIKTALGDVATTVNDVFGTKLSATDVLVGVVLARWFGLFTALKLVIAGIAGGIASIGAIPALLAAAGPKVTAGVSGAVVEGVAGAATAEGVIAAAEGVGKSIATGIVRGIGLIGLGILLGDKLINALKETAKKATEGRLTPDEFQAIVSEEVPITGDVSSIPKKVTPTVSEEKLKETPVDKRLELLEKSGSSQAEIKDYQDRGLLAAEKQDKAAETQKSAAEINKAAADKRAAGEPAGGSLHPFAGIPTGKFVTPPSLGEAVTTQPSFGGPKFVEAPKADTTTAENTNATKENTAALKAAREPPIDREATRRLRAEMAPDLKAEAQYQEQQHMVSPLESVPPEQMARGGQDDLTQKTNKLGTDLDALDDPVKRLGPDVGMLADQVGEGGPQFNEGLNKIIQGAESGGTALLAALQKLATDIASIKIPSSAGASGSEAGHAEGGLLQGPGTGTSDSIPGSVTDTKTGRTTSARFSTEEYVVKADGSNLGKAIEHFASRGVSARAEKHGYAEGGSVSSGDSDTEKHRKGYFMRSPDVDIAQSTTPAAINRFAEGGVVNESEMPGYAVGGIIGLGGISTIGLRHYKSHGGSISGPGYAGGGEISIANALPMPRYAEGGFVGSANTAAAAPAVASGVALHPVTLNIEGHTFTGLRGPPETVAAMERYAVDRRVRQGGKKPSWYS